MKYRACSSDHIKKQPSRLKHIIGRHSCSSTRKPAKLNLHETFFFPNATHTCTTITTIARARRKFARRCIGKIEPLAPPEQPDAEDPRGRGCLPPVVVPGGRLLRPDGLLPAARLSRRPLLLCLLAHRRRRVLQLLRPRRLLHL
jgi:hypothetical protein